MGTGDQFSESTSGAAVIETSLRHHEQRLAEDRLPSPMSCFFSALSRKKPLDCRTDTSLNRCLNLLQLTALGVGSTLGLGLYVLAGQVASNKAGPAVIVSFALAALASAFSALCYAEFAGRVPKAGSAYAYSYITVGEFVAFIIGWNLILEYVIGTASVARGFSGYLQFVYSHLVHGPNQMPGLMHEVHSLVSNETAGPNFTSLLINSSSSVLQPTQGSGDAIVEYLVRYFDWPSVVIIILITIFILIGVKDSTNVTLLFTSVNILVVLVVVVSSIKHLDLHNWFLSKSEVPAGYGEGGFMPYGWSGVLAGSATCFFGFIGFDTIASSAEEAKNPKRNVPLSIILSLCISFFAYMAISVVQTLLWPYYDQNKVTILPYIFGQLDMPITWWIVVLGAIAGLASSQLGGLFPLPRIMYSMAQDRLIYGFFAHVNKNLKLPVRATITGSVFVAALACLLDIDALADMVSIGTLAAYSLVSLSVLILRYEERKDAVDDSTHMSSYMDIQDILGASSQEASNRKEYPLTTMQTIDEKPTEGQTTSCKKPLGPKPSTPIRTRGSKPLVAQLSSGFNSWFKPKIDEQPGDSSNGATKTTDSNDKRRLSAFKLLTSWRKSDDLTNDRPNDESSRLSKTLITYMVIISIVLDIVALCYASLESNLPPEHEHLILRTLRHLTFLHPKALLSCTGCICLVALATTTLMLSRLPTSTFSQTDSFQVPFVPLIPTLSILINTFLMLNLSFLTWVRFMVWMAVGFFIYFTYGIWHSQGYLLHMND